MSKNKIVTFSEIVKKNPDMFKKIIIRKALRILKSNVSLKSKFKYDYNGELL